MQKAENTKKKNKTKQNKAEKTAWNYDKLAKIRLKKKKKKQIGPNA